MHGWNSEQKKQYKLNQMGAGKKEEQLEDKTYEHDDIFTDNEVSDEEMEQDRGEEDADSETNADSDSNADSNANVDSSEEGDTDEEGDSDDEDEYCSDDEEDGRIWRKFRRDITAPYSEKFHEKFHELKQENPTVPERYLKESVYDEFKPLWVDDAADYLKSIITYFENFKSNRLIEKILVMRNRLAKKEGEEEALNMAINLYKPKLGQLFTCDFGIPK